MSAAEIVRSRLCLVTPPAVDLSMFPAILADALTGGDVASLIVTASDPLALQPLAQAVARFAQHHGVAVLVHNDTQVAGRAKADGVHIDRKAELAAAIAAFHPTKIVGAGGVESRHDAMTAGESNPDYVFFGRLDGDTGDGVFHRALTLAEWWSSLFVIPAMVMGGRTVASVREAAAAKVEFVALSHAIFSSRDPAAAVAEANRLLSEPAESVV